MDGEHPLGQARAAGLRIDKTMSVEADVESVFDVLASEESVEQWMTGQVTLDPEVGGEVRIATLGLPVVTGFVAEIDPPRLLSIVWRAEGWPGPLRATVQLRREGDQTVLSLVETGFGEDAELERTRSYLWSHWLIRLAATAAQGRRSRRRPAG